MTPRQALRISTSMRRLSATTLWTKIAPIFRASSTLVLVFACGSPGHLEAGQTSSSHAVLVELFTSQGCSSCPRADAFVSELASLGYGPERVIPLTFHVGYWNAPSWTDPYSQPAFDQRQDRYARTFDGPYTPQMVIDGRVTLVGSKRSDALSAIDRWRTEQAAIELRGSAKRRVDQDSIEIQVDARSTGSREFKARDVELFAALYQRNVTTTVTGGENGGRTLNESFVVRQLSGPIALGKLSKIETVSFVLTRPPNVAASNLGVAVFAQQRNGTVILGASQISIEP